MNRLKKIKVAMVAPPFGEIGGPEVVVKNLTDALLERKIDVTLFAPADWKTKAKHIPTLEKSLWNMENFKKQTRRSRINLIIESLIKVLFYQDQFDLIHIHSSAYAYNIGRFSKIPCVLSFHNIIITPEYKQIKRVGIYPVALSEYQKGKLNTAAKIWNGVPTKSIKYSLKKGKYLIFVGRLTDQKGVDRAIQIAIKAEKKLLIFGRIGNSPERQEYFRKKIKPYLNKKMIIYKKEVSHERIYQYLRNAEATLLPIRRHEVCPMVIMESLACGTPVIGSRVDPLPELIGKNNKIGIVSNNIKLLVKSVKNIDQFDRNECRRYAEKYFDSSVMADKYIRLYEKIMQSAKHAKR